MIYVASPYSHKDPAVMEERFIAVRRFTAALLTAGYPAFSPIVYGHDMAVVHSLPTDATWWMAFNRAFFDQCDIVFVLGIDGVEESLGVKMELEWCADVGKKAVLYARRGNNYFAEIILEGEDSPIAFPVKL